jgi:hypothetical protein
MSLKPRKLKNRIMIGAFVLGKAQKYKLPWRLLIVSFGAGCVLPALEIIWFRFLRLIGLTHEDYPEYYDLSLDRLFEGETETARRRGT